MCKISPVKKQIKQDSFENAHDKSLEWPADDEQPTKHRGLPGARAPGSRAQETYYCDGDTQSNCKSNNSGLIFSGAHKAHVPHSLENQRSKIPRNCIVHRRHYHSMLATLPDFTAPRQNHIISCDVMEPTD